MTDYIKFLIDDLHITSESSTSLIELVIEIKMTQSEIPYNRNFVFMPTKNGSNNQLRDDEKMEICTSILKYSSNWDARAIFTETMKLELTKHQNLFIIVIDNHLPDGYVDMILNNLPALARKRPLLLQTILNDNTTRIYFKDKDSDEFICIEKSEGIESIDDFTSFLKFVLHQGEDIIYYEEEILQELPIINDSELILKFIRTLDFSDEFLFKLALKYVKEPPEINFLTLMNGFIDDEGKAEAHTFLSDFLSWRVGITTADSITLDIKNNNVKELTSILYSAVQNTNINIVNILVENYTNFIQNLPFEHQIDISTLAFQMNHFDILYALLEKADFPFPRNIGNQQQQPITDVKLCEIIESRKKFHDFVMAENKAEIEKFAKERRHLRYAYDQNNKSAFHQALDCKKFDAFFLLKAYGFKDIKICYNEDHLSAVEDKKKANKSAVLQRTENVSISNKLENRFSMILSSRSIIYDRNTPTKDKEKYEKLIFKWFTEIYKTKFGAMLMEAASQCEHLKIIFDFECDSVNLFIF